MADQAAPLEQSGAGSRVGAVPAVSRAQQFRDILGDLGRLAGVRGGLIVTPDGLLVTADLPPRISGDALAALAATLGRELEVGMEQLARGAFRSAFFSADDGAVFVGGSPIGFVIVLADTAAEPAAVTPALRQALDRLQTIWT